MSETFFDFKVKDANGKDLSLDQFKGKVVVAVNVASKCGFTPQYDGLEKLYKDHKEKGLVILGFPCNQFGAQEPGSNNEIQEFCRMNYGVSFPVLDKVDVNGSKASPVWDFMKESVPGALGLEIIKWNFTKFLIDRNGKVIGRFAPQAEPADMETAILNALK